MIRCAIRTLIVLLGVAAGRPALRGKTVAPAPAQYWKTAGGQTGAKMYEWLPSNIRTAAQPYNNDPKAMGVNAAALTLLKQ
jgi:hypothetical protein